MFKLKADYIEYENKSLRLPKDLIEQVQHLQMKTICLLTKLSFSALNMPLAIWRIQNNGKRVRNAPFSGVSQSLCKPPN